MYLSGGNTTANASLVAAENYVMWLARLRSVGYKGWNPAEQMEIKVYCVIKRETLAHKNISAHLTRMALVDKIINVNTSKASWKAKIEC